MLQIVNKGVNKFSVKPAKALYMWPRGYNSWSDDAYHVDTLVRGNR